MNEGKKEKDEETGKRVVWLTKGKEHIRNRDEAAGDNEGVGDKRRQNGETGLRDEEGWGDRNEMCG